MKELALGVIVMALICLIMWPFKAASCHTKGESFEDVRHHLIGGCMVKHRGKWLREYSRV